MFFMDNMRERLDNLKETPDMAAAITACFEDVASTVNQQLRPHKEAEEEEQEDEGQEEEEQGDGESDALDEWWD